LPIAYLPDNEQGEVWDDVEYEHRHFEAPQHGVPSRVELFLGQMEPLAVKPIDPSASETEE